MTTRLTDEEIAELGRASAIWDGLPDWYDGSADQDPMALIGRVMAALPSLLSEVIESREEIAKLRAEAEEARGLIRDVEAAIYWNDDPAVGMVSGWWRFGADTAGLHGRMLRLLARAPGAGDATPTNPSNEEK